LLDDLKSPQQRSLAFAEFARNEIDEAKAINKQALGYEPAVTIFVDGQRGASLESVKNVIVADFKLVDQLLLWIHNQLLTHSPAKTGRYRRAHVLLADGREINVGSVIPAAEEYVFVNLVPYARKIERGSSSRAPDGVYQVVAHLAQAQSEFRNIARITFSYRTVIGGFIVRGRAGNRSENRSPAIVVRGKV
jgi:hypothetical protein